MTSITISTIRNSCIVNNANIAVQNLNSTPLDAVNNWWGMPIGASDENQAGGDLIGTNILSQSHLVAIPPNCDLSDANWIPFNEQELQFAIQSNLPYLNGLDFALLDIIKGVGAKFTLVAKPMYGGASGEALITITPSPDGSFIRIMLDVSQLPADPNLSKIATCELMPLFMNSLQHVQNKFTNPSQLLEQLVVMDSALMLLFSPPTEITPEPAPEIIMNYDASCLFDLVVDNNPEITPEPGEDESLNLVTIPPLEGEFTLLTENNEGESEPEFKIEERLLFHVTYPYPSQNRGIYSADPITGEVYNLLDMLNIVGEVALSPNGDYIVFTGFIAGNFNNFGMFIMRSDGSELRSLGTLGEDYRHIGWTHEADNQWVTFSIGTEEITYAMQPTQSIGDAIVVIPDGIHPKWIGMGVNKVIYTSGNHLFIAEFNPSTFEIVTTPEQITPASSPTGVGHYEWSDNGNDVIFEENYQLWRYRDYDSTPITQTSNGESIGNHEFMTRPDTNHIATVLTHYEINPQDGALYHLGDIQRIHLSTYTIQFANPLHFVNNTPTDWHNWGNNRNLRQPFLSPYRNGNTVDQDLYFVECELLVPSNCYYSYILDANTLIPRAIFQNTPIAGVPAIAWQEFRLPVDEPEPPCSDPNNFWNLTEENTNLADREACWLRYKEIIYLTIYHEFSMDKKLVFTPKTISDTTSFDITQYEYAGIVGDMGLDPRYITNAELEPLQAYDSPYNPYYTFARALLNGMRSIVNPNALKYPTQIPEPLNTYGNPMRYFPNNYLYAVAGVTYQGERWVDNWLVSCTERENVDIKMNGTTHTVPICKNFCAGEFISQPLQSGDNFPVCDNEEWFASQLQANKWAYSIIMPEVEDAIRDMIYRPDNEPVWLSAIYSVVPANRAPIELGDTMVAIVDGVGNFLNSSGYSCFGETKLGNIGQTYIFNTPLGYLWDLTWKYYPSTCNPSNPNYQVFYSEDIWDSVQGGVAHISSYPGSCENVNETLPQAYMRHLRETYGDNYATSTFTRILNGDDIDLLIDTQVRFGMANRSVRMPVLGLEFYTEFPETETPTPTPEPTTPTPLPPTYKISGIVWYTYNFNISPTVIIAEFADQTTNFTIPVTEYEFVVYDANQNLIEPLDEDDCP